jgi:hypothetical protein
VVLVSVTSPGPAVMTALPEGEENVSASFEYQRDSWQLGTARTGEAESTQRGQGYRARPFWHVTDAEGTSASWGVMRSGNGPRRAFPGAQVQSLADLELPVPRSGSSRVHRVPPQKGESYPPA